MSPQQSIAHYRITSKLGEGGMGEVWRATDSKLGREVAIKILPKAFSSDAGRMARFEREAKILASLNHPHIATIYGVEEQALVMELVEGESPKGPLSFENAWKIALQIAEALEYAHEKGVIHRDLKPANVKVTPDGNVKLLDFGLAKALHETGDTSASDPENSPTVTIGETVGGAILGTAAYMAPEQANGRRVDKRCDIWAWGVVLYELLTGKRLFAGETTADTVAQVLIKEPNLKLVPRQVRKLLGRCLEKDSKRRLRDIGDAADLLEEAAYRAETEGQWIRITPWISAALASALAAGALWAPWRTNRPILEDVFRLTMETATAEMLGPEVFCCRPSYTSVTLSPDGKTAVFSGVSGTPSSPQVQLYKRALDQPNAIPLAGTVGARQPFFSPDGQWVGFSAGGKLKKVPLAGGPPLAICDVPQNGGIYILWGASWSSAGNIAFVSVNGFSTALIEVSAAGGTPTVLETTGPESQYSTPHFLPDGKTLLLTLRRSDWEGAQIVARLDTGEQRVLLKGGADARYVPTGHLVYLQNGVLMAVPFDSRRLQLTGPPVALLDGVMQSINMPNDGWESGMGQFAISASGNLLYASGGVASLDATTLVRVDRKGVEKDLNAPKGKDIVGPRVSPDGSSVALHVLNSAGNSDIWVIDTNTGIANRLTSKGANLFPLWSPDGKRILFSNGASPTRLLSLPADGSGAAEPVISAQTQIIPASWPGQRLPLVYLLDSHERSEIWSRPLSGSGEPKRFRETEFNLTDAELSPDGHWIAYRSDESGRGEIYFTSLSGAGRKASDFHCRGNQSRVGAQRERTVLSGTTRLGKVRHDGR